MTILTAIKSGKPFRRKVWGKEYPKEWYWMKPAQTSKHLYSFEREWDIRTLHDILATDWEIKK